MGVECLCFWLACWILLELTRVKLLATQLTLVLSLIILTIGMLFLMELDLLATFILAVYSSVFVALALLALHFGPFWMPATQQDDRASAASRIALLAGSIGALCLCFFSSLARSSFLDSALGWIIDFIWQDVSVDQQPAASSAAGILHWLFYRVFILETIGLNIYLFLGLIGTLTLVCIRSIWLDAASATQKSLQLQKKPEQTFELGARLRIVARFRRQTRRTNTSQIRYR
jgi:hypothetical protein